MATTRRLSRFAAAVVTLLAIAPACATNLNKSISVEAGASSSGESTVNGGIRVGRDAVVDGKLETVNGSIRVDDNARIRDAETVNGAVSLADGTTAGDVSSVNGTVQIGNSATIDGKVEVVNGRIASGDSTHIGKSVSNVNGPIDVTGTEIGGDLSTVNGDVTLSGNTVLRGDLVVEKPNDRFWKKDNQRNPRIIIGPGARVAGSIRLEREVDLFISDSAQVGGVSGVMTMDQAVRFSGDRP